MLTDAVAISTTASGLAALVALLFVVLQLRIQNRQVSQSALIALHEEILRPEIQRAIRAIYAADPRELRHPTSEQILLQIELVLNRYDLIGNRLMSGVIPETPTLQTEWSVALRLSQQLKPFIENEIILRGGTPFKPGFAYLVAKAEHYKEINFPNATLRPFARQYSIDSAALKPRVVFISGHVFGQHTLAKMLQKNTDAGEKVCFPLSISIAQDPKLATVGIASLQTVAESFNIPHVSLRTIKSDTAFRIITDAQPDFIIVIGLSELVPSKILDIPRTKHNGSSRHALSYGIIGMHPTLLPCGRGRAPIPWTIIKNLSLTGVTVFLLDELADAGGVVLQKEIRVDSRETSTTLFEKVDEAHQALAAQLLELVAARKLTWQPQDESKVTTWPKRKPIDSEISFNDNADSIDRLVRAQAPPYPPAYFEYKGSRILVHKVARIGTGKGSGGLIQSVGPTGRPRIQCGSGLIEVQDFDAPPGLIFDVGDVVADKVSNE